MKPKRLSPEEARALVEEHGSQAAAARAHGVAGATFRRWLDPEHARELERRWLAKEGVREREREKQRRYAKTDRGREVIRRARRRRYRNLSGPEYNRLLLNQRRWKALRRMAERNQRNTEGESLNGALS